MIPKDYLQKVYAGFLGMNIGIRLGAPLESPVWTMERIRETYGDITGYVRDYRNFAADDDVNGPYYFLRALYDDAKDRDISPDDVARAWLNYTREGKGMFWWGGYGVSTEHTAYLNLKAGIPAPRSGSIAQNGPVVAQQIGGQIFIDTWGLVLPGRPGRAADFGQAAASVSHDGEGVYGARFFCAAIAKAFVCDDIFAVIQAGLSEIPGDSLYYRVAAAVLDFYRRHPGNFYACFGMLERDWGYDRFPGICHVIPNAGVCVLALAYGGGDFARTVEIAAMCGWDTDCNAGNVGTVLGVMGGIGAIPTRYRAPIGDSVVLSGVSGWLNTVDIPTYAKELALLGYRLAGEEPPSALRDSFCRDGVAFDFELPGSTHNIRLSNPSLCAAFHSEERSRAGTDSLKVVYDGLREGDECKIFYKSYYERADFDDERYDPAFTPRACPGQTASLWLRCHQWDGPELPTVTPYVRLAHTKAELRLATAQLPGEEWREISFQLPDTDGELIDEVGVVLGAFAAPGISATGCVYLDDFSIAGKAAYTVDFAKQGLNFGNISPFVMNTREQGSFARTRDGIQASSCGQCEAYAGAYFATDYALAVPVLPLHGTGHVVIARAQGAMRGYFAGFVREGEVSLWVNDFGLSQLACVPFDWRTGQAYNLAFTAKGDVLCLAVDGKELLRHRDDRFAYGMYGFARTAPGRCQFGNFSYRDL